MKKFISKVLVTVLTLSLMIFATGCGSEQDKLIGTWETNIDMTDYMNDELGANEELAQYIKVDDFSIVMQWTLKEDGTYKMAANEEKTKEMYEDLVQDIEEGIKKYFEDMIEQSSLDMTVDELLEQSGTTFDELIEDALGDELLEDMLEGFESEGKYKVKDGKVYMSDGLDSEIDEEEYETYEISGDELTLLEVVGSEDTEEFEDMYPLVFKKIK